MQKMSSVKNAIPENVRFAMGMSTQDAEKGQGEQGDTKKLKQKRQRNVGEQDQDGYTWDRSEVKLRLRVLAEIQSRHSLNGGAEASLSEVQRQLKTVGSLQQQLGELSGLSVFPHSCPRAGESSSVGQEVFGNLMYLRQMMH